MGDYTVITVSTNGHVFECYFETLDDANRFGHAYLKSTYAKSFKVYLTGLGVEVNSARK